MEGQRLIKKWDAMSESIRNDCSNYTNDYIKEHGPIQADVFNQLLEPFITLETAFKKAKEQLK